MGGMCSDLWYTGAVITKHAALYWAVPVQYGVTVVIQLPDLYLV